MIDESIYFVTVSGPVWSWTEEDDSHIHKKHMHAYKQQKLYANT